VGRLRIALAGIAIRRRGCYTFWMMGSRYQQYRWWLLDGDLDIVSDGNVAGATLFAALADLNKEIDRLGDRGKVPSNQPYSLIVYRGDIVVAVRPATLGIC
jgi:hypothetical protein